MENPLGTGHGGFNKKITDKWSIFHCHVWLPEGKPDLKHASNSKEIRWIERQIQTPSTSGFGSIWCAINQEISTLELLHTMPNKNSGSWEGLFSEFFAPDPKKWVRILPCVMMCNLYVPPAFQRSMVEWSQNQVVPFLGHQITNTDVDTDVDTSFIMVEILPNQNLVGGIPTPLKNMSSSIGMMIPNWMGK